MSFWDKGDGVFFIAELGVNHNGSLDMAKQLVDVAVEAGADAVKFQTFNPTALASERARKAAYQEKNAPEETGNMLDMLRKLALSKEDLVTCREHCLASGIAFMSTPFDEASADLLLDIGIEGYKMGSGELTNLPFMAHVAAKGKPMIISTGMADLIEVGEAVKVVAENGDPELAILHCVSNYPAAPEDCNLRAMDTMATAFGKPVGWSDHTLGDAITLAAVARGARIIEKHYTLDVNLPGPDHKASLTPEELKSLISKVRMVESALGDGIKAPKPAEVDTAEVARRSIVAAVDIAAGTVITSDHITRKRPGNGIAPKFQDIVIGRRAGRDIAADDVLVWDDLIS